MASSLLTLAKRFERRASGLRQNASDLSVQVVDAIVRELVSNTPVDSSQALSNWQVALSTPAQARLDAFYTGEKGSTQEISAAAAMAAARAILRSKKPGVDVIVSNVVPYINRLNEGYSDQAPAGFIERSILVGRSVLAKRKTIVGKA